MNADAPASAFQGDDGRHCLDCGFALPSGYPGHVCVRCLLGEDDSDPMMADAGRGVVLRVPGHDVLEELARGGMGIVYKAWDRSSGRCVALKMLRPQLGDDADMVARFRLEARTLASLQHEAVLPVYRVDENDDLPFFTMKFAAGGTLAERRGAFAGRWRAIAELIATVARAVHYAHSRGVLHRDIKPGNILFDDENHAYLSDFGLVKTLDDGAASFTASGQFLGTPHYAAPEVAAANASAATVASDIWSLGAVLYELLSGRRPFEGDGLPTLLRRIVEEPAPPMDASVPVDLSVICLKCLSKDPAQRYRSAEELASDLDCWLTGRPIKARPAGRIEWLRRWGRRNPGMVALGAGFAAALVLLAAALWRQSLTDRALLRESLTREAEGRAARQLDDVRLRLQTAPWLDHPALLNQIKESLAVRPSPEGRELMATLLSTPSLRQIRTIEANQGKRWAARPSGDFRKCVVLDDAGCAILDLETEKVLQRLNARPTRNYPPGPLSPDGQWLLITGERDTRLYDTLTGNDALTLPRCTPIYSHFSGDGSRLVATRTRHRGIVVVNLAAVTPEIVDLPSELGGVKALAVSNDGRFIAAMKSESVPIGFDLAVHDLESGRVIGVPEISGGAPVHMATFSPDASRLYAVMINGRMAAWPTAQRAPLWVVEAHASGADAVALFDHGRSVVTQGRDGMTRFWDASTGAAIFAAPWRGRSVHASPTGDRILLELADSGTALVMQYHRAPACEVVDVPLASAPPYNSFYQGRPSLHFSPNHSRLLITTGHNFCQLSRGGDGGWAVVPDSERPTGLSGGLTPDFEGNAVITSTLGGIRVVPIVANETSEAGDSRTWILRSPEMVPWFASGGRPRRLFAWYKTWHALTGPLDAPASDFTAAGAVGTSIAKEAVRRGDEPASTVDALSTGAVTADALVAEDGRVVWVGRRSSRQDGAWELIVFGTTEQAIADERTLSVFPADETPQKLEWASHGRGLLVLSDRALRCLSWEGRELWKVPCAHREAASDSALACRPGSSVVAVTLRPEVVTLVDARTGELLLDLRRLGGGAVHAMAMSDDQQTLAVLSGLQVSLWSLDQLRLHGALTEETNARRGESIRSRRE